MQFAKRLRDGGKSGEITSSVRIWRSARVKIRHRYALENGFIVVEAIDLIGIPDITPELARAGGFAGVIDLLKIARHGSGQNVYLVRFRYEEGN